MPSDETGAPIGAMEDPGAESASPASSAVRIATGQAERSRRRRIAILALLCVLIAVLTYAIFYFEANRRLPLPRLAPEAATLEPPQYLYSITGSGANTLTRPIGVGVGSNRRVYVVDFLARGVKVFTTPGTYLFSFNKIDDEANTALKSPVHLAVDRNNNVWVTDRALGAVYVFDADGKYLRKFMPTTTADFVWAPLGIAVDPEGLVYTTDVPAVPTHRVVVMNANGSIKTMYGRGGTVTDASADSGLFSYPNGVAFSSTEGGSRETYIADSNNRRIQVYSAAGSFLRFIRTEGTPRGIVLDDKDRVYVADVLSHQIDIYSKAGGHLAQFGESGFAPGQFRYPEDIALDARGRIYVSDRENNQVQVWGYPALEIPGVTKVSPTRWPWCFAPLPLLLLPLLFRRRRFVATGDFVEGMVTAGMVPDMVGRWRWIVPEGAHAPYVGRVVDGVDLGQLLEPERHSHSDASALVERLGITMDQAIVLSMAKRARILCTEDGDLARLAVLLGVDAYDRAAWVKKFVRRERG